MIARNILFFVLTTILADTYIYARWARKHKNIAKWKTILWFLPTLAMTIYAIVLATQKEFLGSNQSVTELYLLLFGLIVAPKAAYALCSAIGLAVKKTTKSPNNWGNLAGLILAIYTIYVVVIGTTKGINRLEIRQVELSFADLPKSFDGYRIALFSDAHIGTFSGNRQKILSRAIDSINAQDADMIVFAGDLQNAQPQELYRHRQILAQLKATDGVISVLGNHDYSGYADVEEGEGISNQIETQSFQRRLGWRLLMNEHIKIGRNADTIVVAGMENQGRLPRSGKPMKTQPRLADAEKTLEGVAQDAFVVMITHDPTAWREIVLPKTKAQLTLSGHTHGGQVRPFGISPTTFIYDESEGLYTEDNRQIYVTSGIGGVVPIRYGVPPEIVVITLKKK